MISHFLKRYGHLQAPNICKLKLVAAQRDVSILYAHSPGAGSLGANSPGAVNLDVLDAGDAGGRDARYAQGRHRMPWMLRQNCDILMLLSQASLGGA